MSKTQAIIESRFQVGLNIKSLREEQKLSQAQLGLMVGRDRSYISRIEHGKCSATIDTIFLIASGLGIPASELLDVSELQ